MPREQHKLMKVECAHCGWTGRRKPGKLCECPKCGEFAAFQSESEG